MTKWAMVFDLGRCIGCEACVAACIAENRREPALNLVDKVAEDKASPDSLKSFKLRTQVIHVTRGEYPDVREVFAHRICLHCDDAPCVAVCPTGATYQRQDGIVMIDEKKCIGCRYCEYACPYNARFWDETFDSMDKCTFCEHLLEKGQEPACVSSCPAHARIFGDLDNPESEVSQLVKEGAIRAGAHNRSKAHVYYIAPEGFEDVMENPVFIPENNNKMPTPELKGTIDSLGWIVAGLTFAGLASHIIYWKVKPPSSESHEEASEEVKE